MKTHHRLGYARLAEALAESGLVDQKALKEALQYSTTVGTPFPEAIVESNLVTDWDLSRVVCDIYGLPFLTVEIIEPASNAFDGLDVHFLRENGLVPLGRYGQVLTICMPGLVEADTLGLLAAQTDLCILPVVGTVRSNRHWLEMNLNSGPALETTPEEAADVSSGWSSFFDEADAQVLMDLQSTVDDELAEVLGGDEQGGLEALNDPMEDSLDEAFEGADALDPDELPAPLPDTPSAEGDEATPQALPELPKIEPPS